MTDKTGRRGSGKSGLSRDMRLNCDSSQLNQYRLSLRGFDLPDQRDLSIPFISHEDLSGANVLVQDVVVSGVRELTPIEVQDASSANARAAVEDNEDSPITNAMALQPPGFAQWLIALTVKPKRADAILGDLSERFERDCRSQGLSRAKWLYRARVLNSIGPLLCAAAKRFSIFAAVAAVARRCLSS